jgi:hypothetical protein
VRSYRERTKYTGWGGQASASGLYSQPCYNFGKIARALDEPARAQFDPSNYWPAGNV